MQGVGRSRGREGRREKDSQADSVLSMEPCAGDPATPRP